MVGVGALCSVTVGTAILQTCRDGGISGTALVILIAILIGGLVGTHSRLQFERDPLVQAVEQARYVTARGTVDEPPKESSVPWQKGSLELVLAVDRVGADQDVERSRATMRVEIPRTLLEQLEDEPIRGSRIEVSGLPKPSDFWGPPVAGTMKAMEAAIVNSPSEWQRTVAALRQTMSDTAYVAAGTNGPLITGMAIGDDALLSRDQHQAMLTTSLTHLTAVSGSHIAISLAVIHRLLIGRPRVQALVNLLFLVLVVAVVGGEPSVIRATAMSSLAAWAMLRRRPGQPIAMLFAVTSGSILVQPWLAVSVGFALSAAATLGILALGRPTSVALRTRLSTLVQWVARRHGGHSLPDSGSRIGSLAVEAVADAVAVSTCAFAATLPVLALMNPWLPTWGIVANLLVAPIVAPLTLLGLMVAVSCLWWPAAAAFFAALAAPLASWMNDVATVLATWPGARLPWPDGVRGAVVTLVLLGLCGWGVWLLNPDQHRYETFGQYDGKLGRT